MKDSLGIAVFSEGELEVLRFVLDRAITQANEVCRSEWRGSKRAVSGNFHNYLNTLIALRLKLDVKV